MKIEQVTHYKTSDGSTFEHLGLAQLHEASLIAASKLADEPTKKALVQEFVAHFKEDLQLFDVFKALFDSVTAYTPAKPKQTRAPRKRAATAAAPAPAPEPPPTPEDTEFNYLLTEAKKDEDKSLAQRRAERDAEESQVAASDDDIPPPPDEEPPSIPEEELPPELP